jgi:hypothetical protein
MFGVAQEEIERSKLLEVNEKNIYIQKEQKEEMLLAGQYGVKSWN